MPSIKNLSLKFDVSERSIRYDIESINRFLEKNNLVPIERMSKGILNIHKESLKNILQVNSASSTNFLNEYKLDLVLIDIAFNQNININSICEELGVSRSTIKITLKKIEKILDSYSLKLILNPQKGLKLVGEEENIRKIQLKLLNQFKFNKEDSKFKENFLKNYLEKYFIGIDIKNIKIFINYLIKSLNKIISDDAYLTLINYTLILINRTKNKNMLIKASNAEFFFKTLEFECVNKSISLIEVTEDIKLNNFEIIKLTDYLLGSHSYSISNNFYDNWIEIEILVKKIINIFSEISNIDIKEDTILLEGLVNHIKPTVYRIKNRIELENSIKIDFVESYPEIFDYTKNSLIILEEFLGATIPEDEIAFIGVHFKSALDRNKIIYHKKKNVLIVCGLGYGTSKLMAQQIRNTYNINILDTIPSYKLEEYLSNKSVDLIISNLDHLDVGTSIPIVYTNTLLSYEDFKLLDSFELPKYNNHILFTDFIESIKLGATIFNEKAIVLSLKEKFKDLFIDDLKDQSKNLSHFIKENNILINQDAKSWEEAIKISGNLLIENGYTNFSYVQGMIDSISKNGSYMVIDDLVALPHSKNSNNVFGTGMSLICFNEEVVFPGDVKVKNILAFCSEDNKSHLNAVVQFIDMLKKYDFGKTLNTTTSKKKILDKIKKYEFLANFGKK